MKTTLTKIGIISPAKAFHINGSIPVKRISSIDLLRGLIMIIMALDHTRDYFHAGAFVNNPTDLNNTTVPLFFTRWITHFCAPVFVFLAGISAFISGRKKTKKQLSLFLVKRGIWLIFLELTILNFGWYFNIYFNYVNLQVIWALGICMIALSGLIHLPKNVVMWIGIAMIFGHNLFDNFHVSGKGLSAFTWSVIHERGVFLFGDTTINISYPLIPWIGLMAVGYRLGTLFLPGCDPIRRKRVLINLGSASIAGFIILRFINNYGDPAPWSYQPLPVFSFLSFINVTKYPPSLDYLLVTIGPALIFLALTEKLSNPVTKIISVYGRVPMFYYIIHIYLLHLLAMPAAVILGFHWTDLASFQSSIHSVPRLKNYGFSLDILYCIWAGIVAVLYPLCKWYDEYKIKNKRKWWLSYL